MALEIKIVLIVLAIAAFCVLAIFAYLWLTSLFLVNIAISRKEPKILSVIKAKVTGAPKTAGFMQAIMYGGEALAKKDTENVFVTAYDGIKLAGHIYHTEEPRRIIIAMHGWRSSWSQDFGTIANFWHESGCTVIYPEQRGQNNSEGSYMGFGVIERHDCLAWLEFAKERFGNEIPIYLAGVSMGAATVLMAAEFDLSGVHGIMADCGFTNPDGIWSHVVKKNIGLSYKIRRKFAFALYKKKTGVYPDEASAPMAMQKCRVPVLFVHGGDDGFVPPEMSLENYNACVAPKRLLIVPEANHGMSHYSDRLAYESEMLSFFHDYDTVKLTSGTASEQIP